MAITFGLFAAWAVHDTEELLTAPKWVRDQVPKLRDRFPTVPERVWRRLESVDEREYTTAVAAMAVVDMPVMLGRARPADIGRRS